MIDDDDNETNPASHTVVTTITNIPKREASNDACMIVIYGDDIGRRIPLTGAVMVIGRSSKADVQVDQESVSRNHARIAFDGRRHTVVDLGSTNGSYVNDELTDGETALRDGDQIKIGRTIFKFITGGNIEVQYHEEIYRLMTMDGLTGVHNRRYFNESLEKEASRCKRYDRTFSLIVFDIDHFKKINDTHGHLAGDAVLRQLGSILKGRVRRDDTLARTGGEEFAVILPEIARDGSVALANKIRDVVERSVFRFENTEIPVTVSLGVAEWTTEQKEPNDIVKLADEKLYDAKRTGRNRVCF
jgi:two-component system cell cycle response regulator